MLIVKTVPENQVTEKLNKSFQPEDNKLKVKHVRNRSSVSIMDIPE